MSNKLPTIDIRGKQYVQVKDRISFFNGTYPNGRIQTEYRYEGTKVIVKAIVLPDCKNPERWFTGHSQADESQGIINKSAALENAETSAVGRALAMMGIGIIDSVGSADEVKKAIVEKDPVDDWHKPEYEKVDLSQTNMTSDDVCALHSVKMTKYMKGTRTWYSHTDGSGKWCSGKGYQLPKKI